MENDTNQTKSIKRRQIRSIQNGFADALSIGCLSPLSLFDGELYFGHVLGLVAAALIFKVEFACGAADAIAVAFNPAQDRVVRLLQAAETAMMDDRGHRLNGR